MSIPISALLAQPTLDKVVGWLLNLLGKAGFPTTSWQTTSVPRRLLYAFAGGLIDLGPNVAKIVASGFRTLAKGDWLTLIAADFYGLDRIPATFTTGTISVVVSTATTYTIAAGDLVARSSTGRLYRNTSAGVVPGPGSLAFTWQAESPGSGWNVGGEGITELVTPLSGATLSAASGLTWITVQGRDEESDDDLSLRCGEQWDTLGAAGGPDAYLYNAKQASTQVTRARVYENTPSDGHVTLYLAGASGPVTAGVASDVAAWFETNGKRPQCVALHVYPAGTHTITLTGTVKVKIGRTADAKAAIATASTALAIATDFGGLVDLASLIAIVRTAPGVTHVAFTTPVADVALAASELASIVDGLTYVES